MKKSSKFLLQLLVVVSPFLSAQAEELEGQVTSAESEMDNGLELSPEEFFSQDLSVYSPAKKLQKLKNTPSAVYVLTADDIRRSAAENLIDVFRLVPGIEVARVSAHEWAVTSRGFNQVFGNKILLLIDGAPVETPIFNGILWENINIPLDIIERIEVVRGPGATVWGTRAMNGLINVITKDAFTFPYNTVSLGGGNEHEGSVYGRTGGVISDKAAIQTYAKIDKYDGSEDTLGNSLNDDWKIFTGNIRADLRPNDDNTLRLTSTVSSRKADFELAVPSLAAPYQEDKEGERENNRASLNMLWEHTLKNDSQISAEWTNFYERRDDFLLDLKAFYSELELRHHITPIESHDVTYGVNFRAYTDSTEGSDTIYFEPSDNDLEYYRAFFHDEISLIPDTLKLTLGSRFEENSQVGFSAMPTGRLLWNVNDRLSFWTAASRSTGSPARVYDDMRLSAIAFPEETTGLPALVQVAGNRDLESEKLMAYEIGGWVEPIEKLYTSITGFYFRYDDLAYNEIGEPSLVLDPANGPFLLVPAPYANNLEAVSVGVELTADWAVTEWFRFGGSYSHLKIDADPSDNANKSLVEDAPQHMFSVRNHFTLTPSVSLDAVLRHVNTPSSSAIGQYSEGDLRLSWLVYQNLEVELIGRNLFHNQHEELGPLIFNTPVSEVGRSGFVRATYSF